MLYFGIWNFDLLITYSLVILDSGCLWDYMGLYVNAPRQPHSHEVKQPIPGAKVHSITGATDMIFSIENGLSKNLYKELCTEKSTKNIDVVKSCFYDNMPSADIFQNTHFPEE